MVRYLLALVGCIAGVPAANSAAPNISLATMPIGYFGGHHNQNTSDRGVTPCPAAGCRPAKNLAMLAKMRIVMIEKWEVHSSASVDLPLP